MYRRLFIGTVLLVLIILSPYSVRGDSSLIDKTDHMTTTLSCDVYPPYINFTHSFRDSTLPPEEGWYEFVRGYMIITIDRVEAVYLEISNYSYIDMPIRVVVELDEDVILNTTLSHICLEIPVTNASEYNTLCVYLTVEDCDIASRVIYVTYSLDFYLCYTWNFTAHMEPDVIRYVPTMFDYISVAGLFAVMALVCVSGRIERLIYRFYRRYKENNRSGLYAR